MGIIEEIARMQKEGLSDENIYSAFKSRGVSSEEISEAISGAHIKSEVSSFDKQQNQNMAEQSQQRKEPETMQPSILNQESSIINPTTPADQPQQSAAYDTYAQSQQQSYDPQYSPQQYDSSQQQYSAPQYSPSLSSDTISEISEQTAEEKIAPLRNAIEKSIDLKNTLSTRLDYLDERLKRIERILDRLQLSILQKVGDYVTNVEDMKKELSETQKSFKSLASKKHHQ